MAEEDIVEKCRGASRKLFSSEHGDTKADVWVCGDTRILNGKKTKCSECGAECYYDTKCTDMMDGKHKKICLKCAFDNHLDDMSALEQDIIIQTAKMKGMDNG